MTADELPGERSSVFLSTAGTTGTSVLSDGAQENTIVVNRPASSPSGASGRMYFLASSTGGTSDPGGEETGPDVEEEDEDEDVEEEEEDEDDSPPATTVGDHEVVYDSDAEEWERYRCRRCEKVCTKEDSFRYRGCDV